MASEIGKTDNMREFMTTWHTSPRPGLEAWSDRKKGGLLGTANSTKYVPLFRPFDLLSIPNQALVLLENDDHKIGVESVLGVQDHFHRNVDFDTVFFQYCGHTSIETEFGEYEMSPGEMMLIPEGIAHRSTGTADSLRWFAHVNEPFTEFFTDDMYTSENKFELKRIGGPDWKIPNGKERPTKSGPVQELMHCWNDSEDDITIVERDYGFLKEASSTQFKEKVSGIRKVRVFDFFTEIAGKSGGTSPIFKSEFLEIKTYNITGEQFAFHRALRSEEVRIQFRGDAYDMDELAGHVFIRPGDVTMIPRGIAHSVITDPPEDLGFLRLNFYSNLPWWNPNDLTQHRYDSYFECETKLIKESEWKEEMIAAAAE